MAPFVNLQHSYEFILIVLTLAALNINACTAGDIEKVLFRKPLEGGRELVVVRGPNLQVSELAGIISKTDTQIEEANPGSYFSMRLELHVPSQLPIVLSACLVFESLLSRSQAGGLEVLDILVPPEKIAWEDLKKGAVRGIVLATAENGRIILRDMSGPCSIRATIIGGWTRVAALVPLDKTMVSVKLGRTTNNLIQADVKDLRPNFQRHTRFIQAEKEWKFVPIKEEEKEEKGKKM
jgi:hypothetical protein